MQALGYPAGDATCALPHSLVSDFSSNYSCYRWVSVPIKLDAAFILMFLYSSSTEFSSLPPLFLAKYSAAIDPFGWLPSRPDIILRVSLSICCSSTKGHACVHTR